MVLKKWKNSHILEQNWNKTPTLVLKFIKIHTSIPFKKYLYQKKKMKDLKSSFIRSEKTLYGSIVVQLNWVAGISRSSISFAVFESSTKFTHTTVAYIIYLNEIRKVKSSHCFIQFPKLDLNTVKLQLFTDASFNNLPQGSSQAGQIVFLADSNTCQLYWNSSKTELYIELLLLKLYLLVMDVMLQYKSTD